MKKFLCIIALVMALCVPITAFAASYQDPGANFTVEIPEGERIFYYTPSGTNMSDELLATIQDKSTELSLLVASYAEDNSLAYSLDIVETPIDDPASLLAAPAAAATTETGPATQGPASQQAVVSDLSELPDEQIQQLALKKEAEYGSDYTFDPYSVGTVNGKTMLVLTGRHTEDNGYTTKVYMVAQENKLFTITVLYKNDENNTYLNAATGVLHSLQFSSAAAAVETAPQPTVTATPSPAPAPTSVSTPEAAPAPTEAAGEGIGGFFSNLGARIQFAYDNNPYFIYYVVGGIVLIAVIIIVIVLIRSRRKAKLKSWRDRDEGPGEQNAGGENNLTPPPTPEQYQANIGRYTQQPGGYQAPGDSKPTGYDPGDISRYTQQPSGYDMSDISRYTQQPGGYQASGESKPAGYDPEDISRYTQNPENYDVSDISRYVRPPQKEEPPKQETGGAHARRSSTTPKVGSRVERHRKKK